MNTLITANKFASLRRLLAAGLVVALLVPTAKAHHSYTEFDDKQTREIEGTLISVSWQNPHADLRVRTDDGRTFQVESSGINYLRRIEAPLELYKTGSRVKVAGWPSKRSIARMYGTNILSSDGKELVLFRSEPRWRSTAFGTSTSTAFGEATALDSGEAKTLFRVWGTVYADPLRRFQFTAPLALTDSAAKTRAAFPRDDTPLLGCKQKGMWTIMGQPFPMEFVDRGSTIVLRIEEYDSVRTIHMDVREAPSTEPLTPLGYSVGRWEGETLVVETTHLGGGWEPLGPSARLVEWFTPTDDGQLQYRIRITDPDFVTEPAEATRYWVARPGDAVLPFECGESQPGELDDRR